MEIKEGALVKAWLNDYNDFVVGAYSEPDEIVGHYVGDGWWYKVIEIPPALAKQLEDLGKCDTIGKTDGV